MNQTIDFCGIKINSSNEQPQVENHVLIPDSNYDLKRLLVDKFQKEKIICDKIYEEWFDEIHEDTFKKVDDFVSKALVGDEVTLFPNQFAHLLQAATLILGLHTSDHEHTLDKLDKHFKQKSSKKSIKIHRVKPKKGLKRAELLESLNDLKNAKSVLIIIEKTETMETFLLEILIDVMYDLLISDKSKRILLLFCMSGSFRPISGLLPVSVINRMDHRTIIVNDIDDISRGLQKRLITNEGMKMKLGYKLVNGIYTNFTEVDASVANLKYIFQTCMFEHYMDDLSVFVQDKKILSKILKQHPQLITTLRELQSMNYLEENINWSSLTEVVNFCTRQIEKLEDYHEVITTHLCYLIELFKDETRQGEITELADLYRLVLKHDDLARSREVYDAIKDIKRYPRDAIMKRIEAAMKHHRDLNMKSDHTNIHQVCLKYKRKLDNNDTCKEVISEFINELISLAKELKNPLKIPLCEAIYFDNFDLIRKRTMPSTRFDAFDKVRDRHEDHFYVLLDLIKCCNEDISAADLFEDFKDEVRSNRIKTMELERKRFNELKNEEKKVKRSKRSVHYRIDKAEIKDLNEEHDELLKAIYVDLIDSIEQHGLVKRNLTKSRRGMLKKCIWF